MPLFTRKAKRLQTWPANDHPYEGGRHAVGHLLLIVGASSELLAGCRPGRASRLESNLGLDVSLDHRMFSAMRSSCVQTLNCFRSTFLQCGCNSISAHHGPWLHFWLFLIQMWRWCHGYLISCWNTKENIFINIYLLALFFICVSFTLFSCRLWKFVWCTNALLRWVLCVSP